MTVGFHVNNPLPQNLAAECSKCARIIEKFKKNEQGQIEQYIPSSIISNAKGIAILTVVKAGFIWSGRFGSGLVVAKLPNGEWSAPSAISTAGMGFGGQIGGEVTDFVIFLNTDDALKAFSMGGNVTLGGNLSVAAGPVGRSVEAAGALGHVAPLYSYSKTKGLFVGVSLEGSVIVERKEANEKFYHSKASAKMILSGEIARPAAADSLYRELEKISSITAPVNFNPGEMSPPKPSTIYNERAVPKYEKSVKNQTSFYKSTSKVSSGGTQLANPNRSSSSSILSTPQARRAPPPVPSKPKNIAIALYDFTGEQPGDISFKAGDLITVIHKTDKTDDWWKGVVGGKTGDFPANYVQMK